MQTPILLSTWYQQLNIGKKHPSGLPHLYTSSTENLNPIWPTEIYQYQQEQLIFAIGLESPYEQRQNANSSNIDSTEVMVTNKLEETLDAAERLRPVATWFSLFTIG